MNALDEQRLLARTAWNVFGGERPKVIEFWDDNRASTIHLLLAQNRPDPGVTSVATIGLSAHSIGLTADGKPLRVELVGACGNQHPEFANIMATCAFEVINSGRSLRPGAVFEGVVTMYRPSGTMNHVLFVSPFLWEEPLESLRFDDKVIAWLQAVPISEAERRFAAEHGVEALETEFEKEQTDVFDLDRPSVF